MKVSVCMTVFNEEKSIRLLVESLLAQSQKPDEIVVVDGGSSDNTVAILRHLQKKDKRIRVLVQKSTRAEGRNISVELARNKIIAITDGDCTAQKHWLKRITEPFNHKSVDVAAGFYKMIANTPFQKAEAIFLGVTPRKFSVNFLPSTRSIAFRKVVWQEIGGFPEGDQNSAEDTDFNYKAVKLGKKFARVKNARVEWRIPNSYMGFIKKIYDYSAWDAKYGIWWHPTQGLASHNIKAIYKFIRYAFALLLALLAISNPLLWPILIIGILFYFFWAFRKVYFEFKDVKTGLWGVILQISTDFAVMAGFIRGNLLRI